MSVLFLSRAALDLGPVGHRFGGRRTAGYPYEKSHDAFTALRLHHTVSAVKDWDADKLVDGDVEDVRRFMQFLQTARSADLGPEVPYSFVVHPGANPDDAIVAEGRGFGRVGAHTSGENSSTYGVALTGNRTAQAMTPGEVAAVRWIGERLADPSRARATLGHRDLKATACPGDTAYRQLPLLQPPFVTAAPSAPPLLKEGKAMFVFAYSGRYWLVFPPAGNDPRPIAFHITNGEDLAAYGRAGLRDASPHLREARFYRFLNVDGTPAGV